MSDGDKAVVITLDDPIISKPAQDKALRCNLDRQIGPWPWNHRSIGRFTALSVMTFPSGSLPDATAVAIDRYQTVSMA